MARILNRKRDAGTAWLERTNPLGGLSIREAQAVFDAARGGDTQRLHWIFREIESANPTLMTCVERRGSALAGCPWRVTAHPSADRGLGEEQRDAAERLIGGIGNLDEAVEHLGLAFFRGFSYAQPLWEADGAVRRISLLDSWTFLEKDGRLYYNPACDGISANAEEVTAEAGLVGVRRARAIDYPALAVHIRAAVGERDWGRFLERIALPKPAVVMAPNATDDDRDGYVAAAERTEDGLVSVWPSGTTLTDFMGGSRGQDPFSAFVRHQEETVVRLATGGTLGSIAEAGSGTLAGGAQADVWREIVARDAAVVGAALMRGLVRPYLERAFPGRPVCVDFALDAARKPTAQEAAQVAATLRTAGWIVDRAELEEATGFTLEREEAAPAPGGFALAHARKDSTMPAGQTWAAGRRSLGQDLGGTSEDVLKAFAEDTGPAADAIRAFLDDPSREAAEALLERLPGLIPDDPALAAVIAEEMARAMADGLTETARARQGERCRDCGQWLDGNGVCHDCHGKDTLADRGLNPDSDVMQSAEIGKGKSALSKCLDEQVDVLDAVSRSDVGTISFIYGSPVDTEAGKAYGLAHLLKKHGGDGAIENLSEAIVRGAVREPGKNGNKIAIDYRGFEIHLAKTFSRKGKPTDKVTWVITGFKTDKEDA